MEVSSTQIIISILVSAHFGALVVLPLGAPRHSLHTSRHVAMPAMASLTPAVFPRGRSTTWRSSIRSETRHVGGVRGGGRPAARLAITRASPNRTTTPRLPETIAEALETVDKHLNGASAGADLYAVTPEVTAAVRTMVASKRVDGKTVSEVLDAADGVWEVFDMPHMRKLSSPVNVTFKPVRYTIKNRKIRSDVRFNIGSTDGNDADGFGGWLSTAGGVKVSTKRADAVELGFREFWVAKDLDVPRASPRSQLSSPEMRVSAVDALIDTVGNTAFLPSFAMFPLHFFDQEKGLCVFEFPPLGSFIACKRVKE